MYQVVKKLKCIKHKSRGTVWKDGNLVGFLRKELDAVQLTLDKESDNL